MKSKTLALVATTLTACLAAACSSVDPRPAAAATPAALVFDITKYETQNVTVDGKTITVRAYENIPYVAKPVDALAQVMNIYVPEEYFHGRQVRMFDASTAPIFFPNQIGGYMPARPGTLANRGGLPGGRNGPPGDNNGPPMNERNSPLAGRDGPPMMDRNGPPGDGNAPPMDRARSNTIAAALAQGYVVATPGARGRSSRDATGAYTGKAPAAIVDLKAAVRYLRFNDARMPGDAGKIISNGTSAGGALSALLGASGNSPDFEPYLTELGAAPARDDIYAVSAYCPITNLENSDSAYEWLFNGVNDYKTTKMSMLDYNVQRQEIAGTLTRDQVSVSGDLKKQFPDYLNGLHLRGPQGQELSLDRAGNGSFKEYVESLVVASAQAAVDEGKDLSKLPWLTVRNGRVGQLDFAQYVRYAGRLKLPPAFDALDLGSGENDLFGGLGAASRHFTVYSQLRNTAPGAGQADEQTVKTMNAMAYIGTPGSSRYWRIRHGTKDRDTSLAIPVILATTLQNKGYAVDFSLPWDRPHSGDYDLKELFAWIDAVSGDASGAPGNAPVR